MAGIRSTIGGALSMLGASLLLSSCSYSYHIRAVFLNGGISFVPDSNDQHQGTGCLSSFKVFTASGEVVWEINYPEYRPRPCEKTFPLRYGETPNGFSVVVPAKPLRHGVIYGMSGWDGDTGSGSFSFELKKIGMLNNYADRLPEPALDALSSNSE